MHNTTEKSWSEFALERIPNLREAMTNSATKSFMDTLLGDLSFAFGDNPTASSIIRDFTKLPSVFIAVLAENDYGGTGYVYDEGYVYSSLVKFACKSVIIIGYTSSYPGGLAQLETVGRVSNYVCEPFSRFFIIVSQERQKENKTDIPYIHYLKDNFKKEWVYESIGEGILKTVTTDLLGEGMKLLGIGQAIRQYTSAIDSKLLNYVAGSNVHTFSPKDSVWTKIAVCKNVLHSDFIGYIVGSGIWVVDNTGKFATDMITAYLMAPPSRLIQDGTGEIIKGLHHSKPSHDNALNDEDDQCPNPELYNILLGENVMEICHINEVHA
jgi:hypothetical protein